MTTSPSDPPPGGGPSGRPGATPAPDRERDRDLADRDLESSDPARLLLAVDRLPVTLGRETGGDDWTVLPMSGGMVNALTPVLRARGGVWFGWCGVPTEELDTGCGSEIDQAGQDTFALRPVDLSRAEVDGWYTGYANQVLWPVFHGLEDQSFAEPEFWPTYQEVNREFARKMAHLHRPGDAVWINDYQLLLVGEELRAMGVEGGISFFLHIPFPPPELFFRLPAAERVLEALTAYDLLGFQTERHLANFLACLRRLDPNLETGDGSSPLCHRVGIQLNGSEPRSFELGTFPVGIDFYELSSAAREEAVDRRAAELRRRLGDVKILLGVDRLDYTKGIRHKLRAFGTLLEQYPEWRGKVVLLQAVNPSRESVPAYSALRWEIGRLVAEINGEHAEPGGWTPIQYSYHPLDREELLAHYRAADVAAVTPLEDGMNLVAKEYCATGGDEGVLVLSRFAGAAAQLSDGALMVNPWDEQGLAATFDRALSLAPAERRERMERLRAAVRAEDIYHWAGTFLKAALATVGAAGPAERRTATPGR